MRKHSQKLYFFFPFFQKKSTLSVVQNSLKWSDRYKKGDILNLRIRIQIILKMPGPDPNPNIMNTDPEP